MLATTHVLKVQFGGIAQNPLEYLCCMGTLPMHPE